MAAYTKNLQIRSAKDIDRASWDQYVLGHPCGTAYQLFAWGRAVEQAYGFKQFYFIAENGGKVCGIFPLVEFRTPWFGKYLISLPYCDAGGVLANDEEVAQALWEKVLAFAEEKHCGWRIRSNSPIPAAGENRSEKARMVLDLPENSELLLAHLKSKLRSQVKKPLRDGLVAKIGTGELIPDFYGVFAENMRNLGSPVHSRKWIEAIAEAYEERVRVAVVYTSEGIPAAAGIILLHSTTVAIPWASSLQCYNRLSPNMLLYWTLLAFAADHGYKRFDFGRSTPGEGTWRFKEQWGTIPSPLYWYESSRKGKRLPPPSQSIAGPSRNRLIAAALWRKLPAIGANWIGPRIRKYVSL